ncbi:MAG: V-type ATP synthase subunit K [Deinococcales bacterium]
MKTLLNVVVALSLFALFASLGFAQEHAAEASSGLGAGLIGIGAGLAIGLAAIGVGIAQSGIGSAGAGTLAERPEAFGQILIYLVIPETLIIFGFVIAFFLNNKI